MVTQGGREINQVLGIGVETPSKLSDADEDFLKEQASPSFCCTSPLLLHSGNTLSMCTNELIAINGDVPLDEAIKAAFQQNNALLFRQSRCEAGDQDVEIETSRH